MIAAAKERVTTKHVEKERERLLAKITIKKRGCKPTKETEKEKTHAWVKRY